MLTSAQKTKIKLSEKNKLYCPVCDHFSETFPALRKHIVSEHFDYFIKVDTTNYIRLLKQKFKTGNKQSKNRKKRSKNDESVSGNNDNFLCPESKIEYTSNEQHGAHSQCEHLPSIFDLKPISIKKREEKIKKIKFRIISKRGSKIEGLYSCCICNIHFSSGWKYRETTIGEVYLCYSCKNKHLKGRLSNKTILPGSFGSGK